MRIGLIGLGNLGMAMAKSLLGAGFKLAVHNRSRGAVEEMMALGATGASSAAEITQATDIILTCLPDVPTVEDIFLGEDGIVANARPGQILVDHSTVSPSTSRNIARVAEAKGITFLDAPVSGNASMAEAGTLTVLVGGDEETYAKAMPVFQAIGQTILHLGPPGAGGAVKLAINSLVSTNAAGAAEAFNFGVKMGVEPEALLEAFRLSTGRSWVLDFISEHLLERQFAARPKIIDIILKDLELAQQAAQAIGANRPSGDVTLKLYQEVAKDWPEGTDFAAVLLPLEGTSSTQADSSETVDS